MPFTVNMPKLTPTMEEGVISKWLKKENDFVKAGEVLLEITTDKATVEHQALDEGYLRKIVTPEGSSVKAGEVIAIFAASLEESIDDLLTEKKAEPKKEAPLKKTPKKSQEDSSQHVEFIEPAFVPEPPLEQVHFKKQTSQARVSASPLAKAIAKAKNLDLASVQGTGPGGRITSKDLKNARPKGLIPSSNEAPSYPAGSYEEKSLSMVRKTVARRLQESKTFIPHFYVKQKVDAKLLVSTRDQLKNTGLKVTFNDFVIRAAALALREHPNINAGYNNRSGKIVEFKTVDVSFAIALEEGLITPIIRFADYKNVAEISTEVKELSAKARESKLQFSEFKGGSFCVSNLGMYGVPEFSAIINPPQAAILAIGAIEKLPVVQDDKIVIGDQMTLTLSCDHRVIDGAQAATFLNTIKKLLENPASLIAG